MTAERLRPFGTTIFATMTRLAREAGAINLAQGFPDFEGPPELQRFAAEAMAAGKNQYAPCEGLPELRAAVAARLRSDHGLEVDPEGGVVVTTGATEAIAAAILGLLDPGDEALLFEPFYDSYPACLALAGARAKAVTLRHPDYALDLEALEAAVGPRTRLLILNDPHNPTGKVFSPRELESLAAFCRRHDLIVLEDAVYEHLWFGAARFRPIAGLPGMAERTLTISSAGKTFSCTGWKIGWAAGPPALVDAVRAAHQFLTFATATPLQAAIARALERFGASYLEEFRRAYEERRDLLVGALREAGFAPAEPEGSYFVLADVSGVTDRPAPEFARELIRRAGVAALPVDSFYLDPQHAEGRRLLRFAFCKRLETLEEAARRLRALRA